MAYGREQRTRTWNSSSFIPLVYTSGCEGLLISEAVRGEGGILRLEKRRNFYGKVSPHENLAPRDIVAKPSTRK
jgi:aspartate oxidase